MAGCWFVLGLAFLFGVSGEVSRASAQVLGRRIPGIGRAVPVPPALTPERKLLNEHAKTLHGLGIFDLSSLGSLELPSGLLGAQAGLLRPGPGIVGPSVTLSARRAVASPAGGQEFVSFTDQGHILRTDVQLEADLATARRGRIVAPSDSTAKATVPLNTAYWAADLIQIPNDTTIVLMGGNRKLVVIANQVTVGTNVTFTYERSTAGTPPSVPPKPGKPGVPATPPPFTAGSTGSVGGGGAAGGPGLSYDADANGAAPQIEIWTLQLNGSPAFDLKGQDGGLGGRGGDGGDGGDGGQGSDSDCSAWPSINCKSGPGSGGAGGAGGGAGAGGSGGNGGAGGRLALYAPQASITAFAAGFFATVDGGAPGPGGIPGTPGAGGAGGPVGKVLCNVCKQAAANRSAGPPGAQGVPGQPGPPGQPGIVQQPNPIRFMPIVQSDFNAELTKPAIDHLASMVSPQGKAVQGETVTVHGLRFTPGDTVFVLDAAALGVAATTTFLADTALSFEVPAVPGGFRSVQVRRSTGESNSATLYVLPTLVATVPGPRITPGDSIQLEGTGFAPGARVRIDNLDIGQATYITPNGLTIQLIRPPTLPPKSLTADGGEPAQLTVALADGTVTAPLPIVLDAYRILVFGDSIAWGTGLQEQEKFHSLVESHLRSQQPGNRLVSKSVAAHTGARLGLTPLDGTALPAIPGEVPTRYPTIFHQAGAFFGQPEAPYVDLILLDGCVNDVGIYNWMDPLKDTAWIEQSVAYHCHDGMLQHLDRLAQEFPTAEIIVTGNYAPVGPNTDGARLVALLIAFSKSFEEIPGYLENGVLAPNAKAKIAANCATFAQASNSQLMLAVTDANDHLGNLGSPPRVAFADPQFDPAKNAAMSGSESLLYGVQPDGAPEDPAVVAQARKEACKTYKDRTDNQLTCVRASAGHPNPAGAQRYFEAIKPLL
jgi:lysophospholipase L1-like esterase